MIGIVFELVKPAAAILPAAVASPGRAVSSRTGKLNKIRTVSCTDPVESAVRVGGTFQRQLELVCKLSVPLNLFADCRLILAEKIRYSFLA